VRRFYQALDDERRGRGTAPSRVDCLLFAGHTGVSVGDSGIIYGFNPDSGKDPLWLVLANLRNGGAYPGVVIDDTAVFQEADRQGLSVLTANIILPEPSFQTFEQRLIGERQQSQYSYGFPNSDGDCNCTTWLERLALPLLTGNMEEFTALLGFGTSPTRRFGRCV
jgi:hypothetical protein